MATDLEKLVVQLSADFRQFEKGMANAAGVTNKQFNAIERRARQLNKNLDGIGKQTARSFMAPLAGIGAALGVAELIRLTDTWTDMNSRVNLAAGSMEKGAEVMGRLGEVARRTYSSLEQTVESYVANATALRELGYSTSQQLDYTESLNNALVISAAKGQRAEAVQNALAKAMAGGTLQGINLNTVIQQGGRVAEALAAGLGVGVNQLRKMGTEGKLTSSVVFKALTSQMEKLRKEAEAMPATISDGIQILKNALLEYVGSADHAAGVSAKISQALVIMADNFDKTADAALQVASVIAGALIGRSLLKMISTLGLGGKALISFTRALVAARTMGGLAASFGGLSAAAGPVGMLIGGAVVASLVLYSTATADASDGAKRFADRLEEISKRAEGSAEKVEAAGQRYNEALKNALGHENTAAKEQFDDAHDAAIRLLDGAIEAAPALKLVRDEAGNLSRQPMASQDQIDDLNRVRDELKKNGDGAEAAKQELYALANSNPNFQQLADQLAPLLDRLALVAQGAREAAAELAAISGAELGGNGPTSRGGAGNARRDLDARKEESRVWEQEQNRRAQLGKDQLALENEIARVKKQAADDGIRVTDDQIKRIAEVNLAGNASRSGEGKKGKKGGGGKKDDYERLTQSINERIAAVRAETAAMAGINPLIEDYGYAVEKARTEQDLLTAAQKAGKEITPELRAQISALAGEYASASVEAAKLSESQDRVRQSAEEMRDLGKDVMSGFISDLKAGKSGAEALANALNKVADKLLEIAMNSLFDGGGFLGGIFKALGFSGGGVVKAANGGLIRGPGTSRSDSIPARLSDGEFVVNAKATAANRQLLEAINSGKALKLADGGLATLRAPSMPTLTPRAAGGGAETIRVVLQDDSGRMAQIADQRIQTSAGTIIQVSVQQSTRAVKQQMPGLIANAQARQM